MATIFDYPAVTRDNSIKAGTGGTAPAYTANNGLFEVDFFSTGNQVNFTFNGYTFSWTPQNMKYVDETGMEDVIYTVEDVAIEVKNNYARFNRPMTDVDDWFIVEDGQLKHQILVQGFQRDPVPFLSGEIDFVVGGQVNYDPSLSLQISPVPGAVVSTFETTGAIYLIDNRGKVVYTLPQIVVYDSGIPERASTTGKYRVTQNSPGVLAFDIVVDNAWFADPTRVYPIVIDPTIVSASTNPVTGHGGVARVPGTQNVYALLQTGAGVGTNNYVYELWGSTDGGQTWTKKCTMPRISTLSVTSWYSYSGAQILAATNGDIYVYWVEYATDGVTGQTYNNIGVWSGGTFTVLTKVNVGGQSNNVALCQDSNGNIWGAAAANTGIIILFASKSNPSAGTSMTTTDSASGDIMGTCFWDPSSNVLFVTWSAGVNAYIKKYTPNSLTAPTSVTTTLIATAAPFASVNSVHAQMANMPNGQILLIVTTGTTASANTFYANYWSKTGTSGASVSIPALPSGNEAALYFLTADSAGNFYIIVDQWSSGTGGAILYSKNGGAWTTLVTATTAIGSTSLDGVVANLNNLQTLNSIDYVYYSTASPASVIFGNFSLDQAPNIPVNLAPTGGAAVTSLTPSLTGTFSDPDTGDTMSALQVQVYRSSDNVLMWDSGKVAMQTTTGNQNWSIQVSTSANLVWQTQYYWKATTWDSSSLQGAWSSNQVFITEQMPTVTITAPTSAQVLTTSSITAQLSYSQPANVTEASYQFQLLDANGNVLQDSGVINGTNNMYTFNNLLNNTPYQIIAYATTKDGAQGTSTKVSFSTSFTPPQVPTATATNDATNARVRVDFTNPAIVTNLAKNSDFETITGTGTLLSDTLTQTVAPGWTVQSGSFTFGSSGAAVAASGYIVTGTNAWKPLTGLGGQNLTLLAQGTFKTPSSLTSGFMNVALMQATIPMSRYYAEVNTAGNSFYLAKQSSGGSTSLVATAQTPSTAIAASTVYTITVSIDNYGNLVGKLYAGTGTGGTLLAAATATDTSIPISGGFQIGLYGTTNTILTNALVTGPVPDWWASIGYSNSQSVQEGWMALTNANPINGSYSLMMNCVYATGDGRVVIGPNQSATGGSTYTASVNAKGSTTGGGKGFIRIIFLDSTGSTVLSTQYGYFTPSSAAQMYTVTSTAPTNTGLIQVSVGVECFASGDSGTVTYDEVQIEKGTTANNYIRNDSTVSSASNYPTAASNTIYRRKVGDTAWTQLASGTTTPYYDYTCPAGNYEYGVTAASSAGSASDYGKSQVTCSFTGDWLYDSVTGNQFQFLYNRKPYTMETQESRKAFETFGTKHMIRRGPLNSKKGTLSALMVNVSQTPIQQLQSFESSYANHPTYYLKTAAGDVLKVDLYNVKRQMPQEYLNAQAIELSVDWEEVA